MSENFTPVPGDDFLRRANWDHKYRHQNMSVDMDVWYPMLKSITFKTYFIHIKYCEAEAIINFYNYRVKRQKNAFTSKDTKILLELQNKIDYYFNTYDDLKNGAMFRLTGRSGKDMDYYDNKEIYKLYLDNISKISKKLNLDEKEPNTHYLAITTLMNRFKVSCGKDVLNVLLTSQRLFLDMKDWLSHGGKEQIVLRKWDESLSSEREFRCFVVNNELKAICQDERYAFFPELVKNKDLYEKIINDYFNNTFKKMMKIPNYIVDFAILKNNEIKLIEFSPFLRCTSARLFRWDNNHEEMLNGNGKLTVRTEPHPEIDMFVKDWENEILKPSEHFDDFFIYDNSDNSYFSYLKYLNPFNIYNYFFANKTQENKFKNRKIFVVSVLKNNFYWSKKYITYQEKTNTNKLLGKGELKDHIIYVDQNGFGWIKPKKGGKCFGEIYEILYEDFLDIEFFYGQGDTKMEEINVLLLNNNEEIKVYVYILKNVWDNIKVENNDINEVEEYGLDLQEKKFNPMKHIINQQERYLNMSLKFDLKDSW